MKNNNWSYFLRLCGLAIMSASTFGADSEKFPAPAKVAHPTKEAALATVTLTSEAEQRLGIETAPVTRRKLGRSRLLGGEIILPARAQGESGTNFSGQSVFTILPALTAAELVRLAQSQIDADGQVEQAKVLRDAAKISLARAKQLLSDKAGTVRVVEEMQTQVGLAEVNLRTAQARRDLLGPPLLDVADQPTLWVRVPVYVGDTTKLNAKVEAQIGGLGDSVGVVTHPAKPIPAPPSANPAAATVDWFYEVSNKEGEFRLGERVGVTIPLSEDQESLVVPRAALVHDVQGGTWIYEKSAPQNYYRHRVQVKHVVGDLAALEGVKPGANVVVAGVAELFGTEFGAGK